MDIGYFMTWFITQVITIFTYTYTTLNQITFGGTSLLKVILFINVIIPFLLVILSIPNRGDREVRKAEREARKKK